MEVVKPLWTKARKKLRVMKRYVVRSVGVGFVLSLVSALWSVWWIGNVRVEDILLMWVLWSLTMSVVLPAVLDDEFSSD